MRCYSCNCNLSDFESTRKSKITEQYLDLCEDCFSSISEVCITMEEQKEKGELEEVKENK